MGDLPKSPQPNFHSILGIPKSASLAEICKAYKSLVMKWHPDKNSTNKDEAEARFRSINEAYRVLSNRKREENSLHIDVPKTPKTPFHQSKEDDDGLVISSPTLLSRTGSTLTPITSPTSLSKSGSQRSMLAELFVALSRSSSGPTTPTSTPTSPREGGPSATLTRRSTTPIIYSQSKIRRKPPPIEKKLDCSLEDLCHGTVKKIKITRNVISDIGLIVKEEEILKIRVKPGWKKGTKITFEGKGDERLGTLPADIIFVIDEKRHPLFKRDADDLELGVEIPLVQALTGCTIDIPILGGDDMTVSLDDEIVYPGYEKIIPGQGMLKSKEGTRGDLRLKFLVDFPIELSNEQRSEVVSILNECS